MAFVEEILLDSRAFSLGEHCCVGCVVVQPVTITAVAISVVKEDMRKKVLQEIIIEQAHSVVRMF
ncbi:hypothetical protein CEV32_0443 [Brucella rhizosphaerae]|uniref:Uncharacterized protein n=1 Tax=Brucella rhizosphaerae TaxID=571254 RepID=A0A256FI40_9HYPH|nr:hypothetical protein CEV32_0443 [Brucella rhizosphaerae]